MFNRARFCFLDQFNASGDDFLGPKNLPQMAETFSGVCLEATLCPDNVWRVLEAQTQAQIERVIYL
jgi:hypothetical protein